MRGEVPGWLYVYARVGRVTLVCCSLQQAIDHAAAPVRKGVVRVTHYQQRLVLRPTEDGSKTHLYLRYFDNPGGALPGWLIKWAAASGAPKFLRSMEDAARKYSAFPGAGRGVLPPVHH